MIAVIKTLKVDHYRHYLLREVSEPVIMVSFYKKYPSSLAKDTYHVPRDLYLDVKDRRYDWYSKKAQKYGALPCTSNAGSFSDFFLKRKYSAVKELLENNGFKIIVKE